MCCPPSAATNSSAPCVDMLRRILNDYGHLPITSAYANPEWGGARGLVYFTDHEATLAALAVDGTPAPEPRTNGQGAIHHEAWTRDGLVLQIEQNVAPAGYESLGIDAPFTRSRFDFVMQPALSDDEASPLARVARATAG